ncbi:MAG: protein-ADP-ribose hydrolase [Synergistaceae bacterium]|nr:protein-ADP-ribose hydrolase [Synergistaceae bacterium]MBR0203217.1 protein-ADP-ribose hydrolase [Synergistaceae bacterium]
MDSKLDWLINFLLDEMPEYRHDAANITDKRILLRSLMNIRPPMKLDEKFLELQDEFLSHERESRGIVDSDSLPEIFPKISLWQGDITRLKTGAIVNAANNKLLGCFIPCHRCIDNAIHSAAGLQLRDECYKLMLAQGHDELTGQAKITGAYNLPCDYVIHTVGPIVTGALTQRHCGELESCYKSCLEIAEKNNVESIAFCCISTGEFHFPNDIAAKIAVKTVKNFLDESVSMKKIIFNVFKDSDYEIYRKELTA